MADPKKQVDNTTFARKVALRARWLLLVDNPVVMETHAGFGRIFQRCYSHIATGIAIDSDPLKAAALALQRPTWAVYECAAETAIGAGLGRHLEVNFLDVDPYGEPWPVLDSFFQSDRPRAARLVVCVNDGLRQKLRVHGGWSVGSLRDVLSRRGNAGLYAEYIAIARELLALKAAKAGYSVTKWSAYYCGLGHDMTHYAALLEKPL